MAEKLYETLAKEAQLIIHDSDYVKSLKEIVKNMMDVKQNQRYSDFGKEELLKNMRKEFADKNKGQNEKLREVIRKFCDTYGVTIPDDGENHSADISNVLKIIDMCGVNLSAEILKTAIEPIKDSPKLLKMVGDVIDTKSKNTPLNAGSYDTDIFNVLDEYQCRGSDMISYSNEFSNVESLLNDETLIDYRITDEYQYGVSNGYLLKLTDFTPYSVICLGDNMMKIGKMYDEISLVNPRFFK